MLVAGNSTSRPQGGKPHAGHHHERRQQDPQPGYGVFQMSSDEAAGHLLGRAVAEQADESILADDVVDLGKLSPVTFDPALRAYRTLGPVVGKARSEGMSLR